MKHLLFAFPVDPASARGLDGR